MLAIVNAIAKTPKGQMNKNPLWVAGVFAVITTVSTMFVKDSKKHNIGYQQVHEEERAEIE